MPVEAVYPIVAWGKDSAGVIIEITNQIKGVADWYKLSDEGTSARSRETSSPAGAR